MLECNVDHSSTKRSMTRRRSRRLGCLEASIRTRCHRAGPQIGVICRTNRYKNKNTHTHRRQSMRRNSLRLIPANDGAGGGDSSSDAPLMRNSAQTASRHRRRHTYYTPKRTASDRLCVRYGMIWFST